MAISLYTVTGNAADILGTNFDPKRVKVVVSTNLPAGEAPIDLENNRVLLGGGVVWPQPDGSFAVDNLVGFDSDDVNPSGMQYKIDLTYVDVSSRKEATWSTGWVSITEDVEISALVAEQYVPPTYMSGAVATLQELVDQGEGLVAQQEEIAGLANSDAAQAYNIANGPLTIAELSTSYAVIRKHDGSPVIGKVIVITMTEDETEVDNIAVYDDLGEVGA